MKTSILICATCLIVSGCQAQLRFPSLSSALSSLTGFGSQSQQNQQGSGSGGSQASSSSPYSGLVRDYGRNLMMAMSNIYPTLFKPPQQQQQQPQQPQAQAPQSPFDQAFAGSSFGSGLYPSQSAPSFSFGGSTFSISPSLPFGSLSSSSVGPSPQASQVNSQQTPHSPFTGSFGSSINSPSSFGPLSSSPFLGTHSQLPSFAPATSYGAAFEAANGGPAGSFGAMSPQQAASMSAPTGAQPLSSYGFQSLPHESLGQHQSSSQSVPQQQLVGQQQVQQQPTQQQVAQFGQSQQHQAAPGAQYQSQQYNRPDVMSMAGSAPMASSNSYSNYASIPSGPSQQAPASPSSYQQPSYR